MRVVAGGLVRAGEAGGESLRAVGVFYWVDDAVEDHPLDAVGVHGGQGCAEKGAVGLAPETQQAIGIESVDDLHEVARCEACADERSRLVLYHEAGIGVELGNGPDPAECCVGGIAGDRVPSICSQTLVIVWVTRET